MPISGQTRKKSKIKQATQAARQKTQATQSPAANQHKFIPKDLCDEEDLAATEKDEEFAILPSAPGSTTTATITTNTTSSYSQPLQSQGVEPVTSARDKTSSLISPPVMAPAAKPASSLTISRHLFPLQLMPKSLMPSSSGQLSIRDEEIKKLKEQSEINRREKEEMLNRITLLEDLGDHQQETLRQQQAQLQEAGQQLLQMQAQLQWQTSAAGTLNQVIANYQVEFKEKQQVLNMQINANRSLWDVNTDLAARCEQQAQQLLQLQGARELEDKATAKDLEETNQLLRAKIQSMELQILFLKGQPYSTRVFFKVPAPMGANPDTTSSAPSTAEHFYKKRKMHASKDITSSSSSSAAGTHSHEKKRNG